MRSHVVFWSCVVGLSGWSPPAFAQSTTEPQPHQHPAPVNPTAPGWHVMQDGVVYGLFNQQGGPRGGRELVVPNWWMGMWMRDTGSNQFGLNAMLSLDPATVGTRGYREIFQVGEAFEAGGGSSTMPHNRIRIAKRSSLARASSKK